ncbi:WD repeat-containing 13 [Brachionus plicatilis]|uniref:WD repeat-containing 13 n=1 Tax=Brachionus plicatilis TaxID=10195 RepID=A0A3M7QH14_BRAPC|nr:WD repeat-containing 13 [Brachionus plicatilis]
MNCTKSNQEKSNNIWQEILSLDAKFNFKRINHNSQLRTLYLRRRAQIMRENSMRSKDEETLQKRREYLNLRTQILEQKFGQTFENSSLSNYSLQNRSRTNNKAASVDSISLNFDIRDNFSRKLNNFSNMSNILNPRISNLNCSRESLNSNHKSVINKQNYDDIFCAEVHHIFNNHAASITRVKFANNDRSLLASCSSDGTLAICQVIPAPATMIYKLEGHKAEIMDMQWSTTNDLIVTASLDGTSRVWQVTKGKCMRILRDTLNSEILCCCFLPTNENMIFTGNSKGLIQVYNLSTGIIASKNCLQKVAGKVQAMCFDSTGSNLWVGDNNGAVHLFQFNIYNLKLNKTKKIINNNGYSITSLSFKHLNSKESALLVNSMPNFLLLYKLINSDIQSIRLRKRILIKQNQLMIKSTFCPVINKKQQNSSLVCTGSEDNCVYIYDMDFDENPLISKLQKHDHPVIDVGLNYDLSLMASGDANGTVIIWKMNNQT